MNSAPRLAVVKAELRAATLAALLAFVAPAPAADEVSDAFDASLAAQRAAKDSQARVDKLDEETRALRQKRRDTEWRALQLSSYAAQLEGEAVLEERKRKDLEDQIARTATTGADLTPLMRRMVAELEAFVAQDLPFLSKVRRQRIEDLKAMLDDEHKGSGAEKFRRILEAYRTEVDYGHSLGAEDGEAECDAPRGPVTFVRVGRVGLYCLTPDGKHGGAWNGSRYEPLKDSDELDSLRHARSMARAEEEPRLLQLPVKAAVKARAP